VADRPDDVEEVQRVVDTVGSLEALTDPADRARRAAALLAEWPLQHSRLREIRQQAVLDLRGQGLSYRKISELIGVHFTRVKQIELGERGKKEKAAEE
jgi:DNA-directed RNA polymerase specialized sigma24 family protein